MTRKRKTLTEKLRTCTSLDELDGMVQNLSGREYVLTEADREAVALCKIDLQRGVV